MNNNFINPYNFFPLEKEAPSRKGITKGNLSGVIEYSLKTKTELFIPNASNEFALVDGTIEDEKNKHKSYEFFSYDDWSNTGYSNTRIYKPVIPGSEVRGMFRNVYEMLTNSCLAIMNNEPISKRTAEVFKPGLIKRIGDNKYELCDAIDYVYKDTKISKNYKEGEQVRFKEIGRKGKPLAININGNDSSITGYLIKGEKGPKKHNHHIFKLNEESLNTGNRIISLESLTKCLEFYKVNNVSLYKEYTQEFNNFKKEPSSSQYFPVYYSCIYDGDKELIFLSPASITREVGRKKGNDLINEHKPCTSLAELCPACRLFGMQGDNGVTLASRLRFTDLETNESNALENSVTLKELASPKLQNMEFYMKRPNDDAIFWTYEYWIDKSGKIHVIDGNQELINGRKFYWHNLSADYKAEKSKLNITIRPVKKSTTFHGKMYFNSLTKDELNNMIFILSSTERLNSNNEEYAYKLGLGKPYGFGSVHSSIQNITIHKYNVSSFENTSLDRYDIPYNDYTEPEFNNILDNFRKIISFNSDDTALIDYPHIENNKNIYSWFIENHKAFDNKREYYNNYPNSRKLMYYDSYLKPLETKLSSTGLSFKVKPKKISKK